jgi:hypothetical protein
MSEHAIEHCPDVELTKLPSDDVKTYDGQVLRLGSVVYFRLTPTRAATEYVVVSDRAIRRRGGHEVIVVGPRNIAVAMNPMDLVTEPEVWWEFWKRHYGTPPRRQSRE